MKIVSEFHIGTAPINQKPFLLRVYSGTSNVLTVSSMMSGMAYNFDVDTLNIEENTRAYVKVYTDEFDVVTYTVAHFPNTNNLAILSHMTTGECCYRRNLAYTFMDILTDITQ